MGANQTGSDKNITERKEAEDALRESEERYRNIIENANDMIQSVGPDGHFEYVNQAWLETLGYTETELPSLTIFDIIHSDSLAHCHELFQRVMAGEALAGIHVTFVTRDGRQVFVEGNVAPRHVDGKVIASHGFFHDVTERKEAEEEIEINYRTQNVINSILRVSLEPTTLKEQLERILHLVLSIPWLAIQSKGSIFLTEDSEKVLVMKAQKGLHESLLTACEKVPFGTCLCGRAAVKGEVVFVDHIDDRHDTQYEGIVPHGHYCVPIMSGKHVIGVLNTYVEEGHKWNVFEEEVLSAIANTLAIIIERRQATEKLEDTYAELEEAYEELKDVDRVKDDIISNVSHELRTPITIVKGAIEIARDEEDAQARNRLLEMARRALVKQNRIVGNLVEMAKVQKKKLELSIEEVELNHVVSLAIGEMKHDAEGRDMKIEQEEFSGITVMADFGGTKRVLLNLLDNAIKFTDIGGRIKVSAEVKGDMTEVCVEDTGIGIPQEFQYKIFDRLFQLDATTTRRFAGTGMGLAVAKEIIEAHGGKIWVKGKKKGSRLCFTLPLSKKG